jgi:hypothetical protein
MLEKKFLPIIISLIIVFFLALIVFFKVLKGEIGNQENWRIIFASISILVIFIFILLLFWKKRNSK